MIRQWSESCFAVFSDDDRFGGRLITTCESRSEAEAVVVQTRRSNAASTMEGERMKTPGGDSTTAGPDSNHLQAPGAHVHSRTSPRQSSAPRSNRGVR